MMSFPVTPTQKPTKLDGNDTTILSHHPYILCHANMYTTKLSTCTLAYSHPLNECISTHQQVTQHCSLSTAHSTDFHIQDNPYLPCSAATKVHNITHTPTCHTDSALLMHSTASAYKTDCICHAQVTAAHNTTHSQCASACTKHPALPTRHP